ncbi:MAG: transglutaminase family protein [Myxococcales bacterium]|nr:transglutaminase family protein [Myxococcales bacterium]
MSIRVALHHHTRYRYDRRVGLGPQVVRLRPAPHARTPIVSYSLKVEPAQHFVNWQQDPQGNYLARYVFEEPVDALDVRVDLVAELYAVNPFDFFLEPDAEKWPLAYAPELASELAPFLTREPAGPGLEALLPKLRPKDGVRTIDCLVSLNQRLSELVEYVIRLEPGVQSLEETLKLGKGSCRDSAWLLVQLLRHMGLAARFASGYLIQLVADEKPLEGPAGPSADFTDLHAWTEVYLPGAGWVGLDPTSGLFAGEGHIPLACTPEPSSAAPISGAVDECEVDFSHEMRVERVRETPRVTKPYSDSQWRAIDALGARVQSALDEADVRLTMGGEPTFVAVEDPEAPEWNTDALGPTKHLFAEELLERMAAHHAPAGLRHFGQGKWYPGEQLPRWAYSCHFRVDGTPLWRDAERIARLDRSYGHGPEHARAFAARLAERLEVDATHLLPAYEDTWYHLWRERRLPDNVDPLDNRLHDPMERARLAKTFEQGLSHVVGYALPLRGELGDSGVRWCSGPMFLRSETLFLMPGDSPMGYRLPLDSLPWAAEVDLPQVHEADPHWPSAHEPSRVPPWARAPRVEPARARLLSQSAASDSARALREAAERRPEPFESAADITRSVLCVEAREGRLHVFMPPVERFDAYAKLVAAIEGTAAELDLQLRIEGYPPPRDPRVSSFSITPDPGVLEVNVQPASNWQELRDNARTLYTLARETRLGTEKFMLDGRHSGTGGGNHITLGGPTPPESPLLRRPDLLRSLVGYWHDHPSLSYLFSGLFIGPTSQAPRVDEARHESVHELEVAFRQIPDHTEVAPWLVDRVFRHLLTDLTGNTHRAEFCIDKLYSPDGPAGRLGLLELRAFEMPPHWQMSATQQLLVRALVARFWHAPYAPRLVRWGTSLHDRFMLPHFVAQDFRDVLRGLAEAGLSLDEAWFAPHFEFRFPTIGEVCYDGVALELQHALEPWHVLGEEAATGGTARYVDSSLERIQVRLRAATDGRHLVTCNGRTVPLHPTGRQGEYVAGVRFRAWQPPSCLHPTIGVHAPLVFDLIDTWVGRALGGCTYHVSHPGGRSFEDFPVNAAAAETRRRSRLFTHGHTPGPLSPEPAKPTREFPLTLDLRHP